MSERLQRLAGVPGDPVATAAAVARHRERFRPDQHHIDGRIAP
jgi:hypothetical protein